VTGLGGFARRSERTGLAGLTGLAGVSSRLPRSLTPTAVVLVVGAVIVLVYGQQYTGSVFVLAACYAIVTAGMAVQIGFSQQIAFSQSVFMGVGAYGVAMLNTHFAMPVLVATPIVLVGAGLVALLLGSVVTRASGLALAVATLMLPLIAAGYVSSAGYLGGVVGAPLTGTLWPSSSSSATVIAVAGGLIVVVFLAIAVFVASRILTSDIGLELFVLGVDERTAAAMGVRTPRRKLELFVLGCVFAALGGAAYAGTQQFVPETLVDPTSELALLIMLFIGGRRSIIGAVIGALVIQYLQGASNWVSVNILVVEGLRLTVLDDVTIKLPERGLFGLCGPNGAGKTTLLNVIGGSVPPGRGTVILDGEDITRRPPQERFHLGISRTFQAVHLIKGRTVLDNVAVACLASHTSSIVTRVARSKLDDARDKAARTLSDLGMRGIQDREVSSLTLESQRMVELARALAANPRLLLLDEPASGLSEEQRHRLAELLTAFGERTCVLLVEHDLDLVAQVSERIFVLSSGRLVFDGGPADFRASPVVNSLLVGL
jgi:branched-chain amino acid transport system ATP-binding protein